MNFYESFEILGKLADTLHQDSYQDEELMEVYIELVTKNIQNHINQRGEVAIKADNHSRSLTNNKKRLN
jgi:hypothetical protein